MLDTFKIQMNRFLGYLVLIMLFPRKIEPDHPYVPSNWVFYDSMTYFALKVIEISGSL